jgi:hypothetical protein
MLARLKLWFMGLFQIDEAARQRHYLHDRDQG